MKSCKTLKGGLQEVADDLGVRSCPASSPSRVVPTLNLTADHLARQVARIGPQHQAGSDSLLTAATFFKMRDKFFESSIDTKFMVSASRSLPLPLSSSADNAISPAGAFAQGVLYGLNSSSTPGNPAYPREYIGAVHYPINMSTPTPQAAPLAAAASSAIAIMSPSPKPQPR